MTPERIEELNADFAAEIEAEIRARHQPRKHRNQPCPTGGCCSCMPLRGGCDAGFLLVLLDKARQAPAGPGA